MGNTMASCSIDKKVVRGCRPDCAFLESCSKQELRRCPMQPKAAGMSFPVMYSLLMHTLIASFLLTLPIYSSGVGPRSFMEYFVFLRGADESPRSLTSPDAGSQVSRSASLDKPVTPGLESDMRGERPAAEGREVASSGSASTEAPVEETARTGEPPVPDKTPEVAPSEEKSPKADIMIAVEEVKKKPPKINDEGEKNAGTQPAREQVSVRATPAEPSAASTSAPVSIFESAELSPKIAAAPLHAQGGSKEKGMNAGQKDTPAPTGPRPADDSSPTDKTAPARLREENAGAEKQEHAAKPISQDVSEKGEPSKRVPESTEKKETKVAATERPSPDKTAPARLHEENAGAEKQEHAAKPISQDISEKGEPSKRVPEPTEKKETKVAATERLSPVRSAGRGTNPQEKPTIPAPPVSHAASPAVPPPGTGNGADATGRVDTEKKKPSVIQAAKNNDTVPTAGKSALGISGAAALLPKDIVIEVVLTGKETPAVSARLFLRSYHPSSKVIAREKDRPAEAEEEDNGQMRAKRIFSIVNAHKGIYTFVIGNDGKEDCIAGVAFHFFEGTPKERKKGYRAVQLPPGTAVKFKFLLPDAIFWDDEDRFTGSTEDSDSITKFNSDTGLAWREEKDY